MADLPKLPKRPNYFQAQFLVVRDFDDEQAYHKEMLRRHNRNLHEWGVVRDGLSVTKTGDNQNLSISPGSAIDSLGREIVLEAAQLLSLDKVRAASQAAGPAQDVAITIAFREADSTAPEDKYPGTDSVTRQMQSPIIDATKTPATDGSVITLARVSVSGADVGQPNNAVRKVASSYIARGSNLGDISLDGALSFTSKSSPNPTFPQVGLDYDLASNALRIRARTKDAPALDATYLTIKRDTGSVGIGTTGPNALLDVFGGGVKIGALSDTKPAAGRELVLSPISGTSAGIVFQHNNVDTVFLKSDGSTRLTTFGGNAGTFLAIDNKGGNVGIGTDKPTHQLTIEHKTAAAAMRLKSTVDGGDYGLLIGSSKTMAYMATAQPLSLQSSLANIKLLATGNVGIGTGNADPTERLDVRSSGPDVTGSLRISNSDVTSFLGFFPGKTSDPNPAIMWPLGNPLRFATATKLENGGATGFAERLRITGDGSVGIGTTDPKTMLHIKGAVRADNQVTSPPKVGESGSTGDRLILWPGDGNTFPYSLGIDNATLWSSVPKGAHHAWFVGGAEKMRVDASGEVGIGTTKPLGPLSVGDSSVDGSDGYIVIGKRAGGGTRHFRMGFDAGFKFIIGDYGNMNSAQTWKSQFAIDWNAPSDLLYLKDNGNVGVGTTNPVIQLQVQGQIAMTQTANDNAARAILDKLPNSTAIIGGPWSNGLYFYWKNPSGVKYSYILQGNLL